MKSLTLSRSLYCRIAYLLIVGAFVAACTTQLAPSYDASIFEGLTASNKDVQTLFASLTPAVSNKTYGAREPVYNHIIGQLDALEIQARSRPIPSPITLERANTMLSSNGLGPLSNDSKFTDFPSARSIHDASETIKKMRLVDQRDGLRGAEISAFENQTDVYLAQAITYEAFLKR
ncbi:hypothetical protein [Rhizobium ruizarguesonis]|uniref:hypothetical protein n=1 Tax=Rhizobium ruizarguesonis TaxID=2081791 RepID=UPI0010325D8F|nr:hypothetical protein [Rhizobium ruizarguesonis]TBA72902.1 hypothetical protein ELH56_35180 [Rhizobium ruizarguesonis]WSH62381.1 hypothetical protein U8P68_37995 [Rhizobium ruizarguesonis]